MPGLLHVVGQHAEAGHRIRAAVGRMDVEHFRAQRAEQLDLVAQQMTGGALFAVVIDAQHAEIDDMGLQVEVARLVEILMLDLKDAVAARRDAQDDVVVNERQVAAQDVLRLLRGHRGNMSLPRLAVRLLRHVVRVSGGVFGVVQVHGGFGAASHIFYGV